MGTEARPRTEQLYEKAVEALNHHQDPFSPTWRERNRMSEDETRFLMDVISARIAYGDKWITERMHEQR